MVLIIALFALVLGGVDAHNYGADIQACESLVPGHTGTRRQDSESPFRVETNIPGYVPCATNPVPGRPQQCGLIVRIRSRDGGINGFFKGFILQARGRLNGQMINIGEFRYINEQPIIFGNNQARNRMNLQNPMLAGNQPRALGQVAAGFNPRLQNRMNPMNPLGQVQNNVVVQRLNCPRGFTVTHTESRPKNQVLVKWYPPAGFNDEVQFVGTVVRDFNTYWTGHRSMMLKPRPRLAVAGASIGGQWYSSATRATSGLVVVISSLCALLMFLL